MLNGIALIALGAYGVTVIINGRVGALFDLLKNEGDFLIWVSALGIVYAIYQNESLHPVGKGLAGLTIAGLAVKVTTNQNVIALASEIAGGTSTFSDAFKQLVPKVPAPQSTE